MNGDNEFALTLSSDAFNALKSDFNQLLRQTLSSMEQKEAEEATINMKLGISLSKEMVPDPSIVAYDAQREIIKPKFTHKVGSIIQYKDEKSGVISGDYELVWDSSIKEYVLRKVTGGQTSIFDADYTVHCNGETEDTAYESVVDNIVKLPGTESVGLPQHSEEDGYEYEEPEEE